MSLEQWDIVTGVGITALGVAGGRAIETSRPDGLITDPYADLFVEAAQAPAPIPTRLDESSDPVWGSLSDYVGVRSLFFDRYLTEATRSGASQVVLMAAGLDTRAYRLQWPSSCRLFEVDQPAVLSFKDAVLDAEDAHPSCARTPVGADLREDWPRALRDAGFDPTRPTAWLLEGLLPYLPPEAERALLEHVRTLSAPGSRVAIEHVSAEALPAFDDPDMRRTTEEWGVDLSTLWHTGEKQHPTTVLTALGWNVESVPVGEVANDYNRPLAGPMARTAEYTEFVTATLPV